VYLQKKSLKNLKKNLEIAKKLIILEIAILKIKKN